MKKNEIDSQIYELYDEFCHTGMDRREFFRRAGALTVAGSVSGIVMAKALLPNYAKANQVSFTDDRIKASYVKFASPGGNSGEMRGYLVKPKGDGPFPSVLVIHENRGLNPHIEDVARRAATEGFLALAPDALHPVGGYPGNDEDGKTLQAGLDQTRIFSDLKNSAVFLRSHALSTGKLGVTGFCFGGAVSNKLAVEMSTDLKVAVPFYGVAPDLKEVKKIRASLLIHYAENDPKVNATRADYEAALKTHKINFESFTYPGTEHGFHNNSTPRYNEAAAKLAWDRTIAAFKKHLL